MILKKVARQAIGQFSRVRRQSGTIWQTEGNYTATGGQGRLLTHTNVGKAELDGQGTRAQQMQREGDRLARFMTERPSSVIEAVSYDAKDQIITITFPSGETYDYDNINLNVLKQWAYAPSMGSYFARFIRPKFIFR
ncbi:MAG: KTSC domain-containing protein [Chitinivibrionia bacterium]|nr:KTSC domain-containing protein [Chitinivibrionia bacterium]